MKYNEIRPGNGTASVVDRYFYLASSPGDHNKQGDTIVPDNTPGLLIVMDSGFERRSGPNASGESLHTAYIFGQKTFPVQYVFPESGMECIGLKFRPAGLARITGLPSADLHNAVVPVEDILPGKMEFLKEQLAETSSLEARLAILEHHIENLLITDHDQARLWTEQVVNWIYSRRGMVTIREISNQFSTYPKMLERRFLQYVGITPKTFCRVIRFNTSIGIRQKYHECSFSEIAQRSGYFDQMHYIREFREFAGVTPKQYFSGMGSILSTTLNQGFRKAI